ncbi:hypothetical protein [Streptomyces sp. OM5714]|uniref:hypothetical protein n=1 Tax=Streptomyces sp. OM5714 TaxID=2602736 RepID=UPI0013DB3A2A|nr:hypothetical protein [Streptomyces sp. OM5714]KAF2774645.1 hypothetical protein STPH1_7690 [Streptomyces sp. OM5714]
MGFFKDRHAEIKAAVDAGDIEHAADLLVHTMHEGPGSPVQNLGDLADSAQPDKD